MSDRQHAKWYVPEARGMKKPERRVYKKKRPKPGK
jgi:hypothetical protein